jgi:hypothetical protein
MIRESESSRKSRNLLLAGGKQGPQVVQNREGHDVQSCRKRREKIECGFRVCVRNRFLGEQWNKSDQTPAAKAAASNSPARKCRVQCEESASPAGTAPDLTHTLQPLTRSKLRPLSALSSRGKHKDPCTPPAAPKLHPGSPRVSRAQPTPLNVVIPTRERSEQGGTCCPPKAARTASESTTGKGTTSIVPQTPRFLCALCKAWAPRTRKIRL